MLLLLYSLAGALTSPTTHILDPFPSTRRRQCLDFYAESSSPASSGRVTAADVDTSYRGWMPSSPPYPLQPLGLDGLRK
ncbi:mCG1027465 [Mus musculus]|nr:mCG1027465 [Mus musculus]